MYGNSPSVENRLQQGRIRAGLDPRIELNPYDSLVVSSALLSGIRAPVALRAVNANRVRHGGPKCFSANELDVIEADACRDFPGGLTVRALTDAIARRAGRDSGNTSENFRYAIDGGALPDALGATVETILLQAYAGAPNTVGGWTSIRQVPNFRLQNRVVLEASGSKMQPVPRGSVATEASVGGYVESYRVIRFGRRLVLDEQDILGPHGDELIRDLPANIGKSAGAVREDVVYLALLSNPVMADGNALFSEAHGNALTLALDKTSLGAAIAKLETQNENGLAIDAKARYLIVPPALKATAGGILRDLGLDVGPAAIEIRSNQRISDGVTDPQTGEAFSGSPTAWFLAASAEQTPIIEIGCIDSSLTPRILQEVYDQGQWGVGWLVNLDAGARAIGWRGIVRGNV
jgi:hypothetical protein